MIRFTVTAFILATLVGCATQSKTKDELEGYIGSKLSTATARLGNPRRIIDMGDGTKEHSWRRNPVTSASANTSIMGVPLSKSTNNNCTITLVTDGSDRVISYRTSGRC